MAGDTPEPAAPPADARPTRGWGGVAGRMLARVVVAVLLLAALLFGAVRWADSEGGRRFVARQIAQLAPASGLKIAVARIDGSIYGRATLHGVTLSDPQGVFAEAPVLVLDWRPLSLAQKLFQAREISAPSVRLLRLPKLNPSQDDRILPDFDFDIGRLRIDRLVLEAPVSGQRRVLGVGGSALIRAGRAKVDLAALTLAEAGQTGPSDTLRLMLDAEPDRDRFDIDATVVAPQGGAIGGLLGLKAPLDVRLAGDGAWRRWQGRLAATLGGQPLATADLTNDAGAFALKGEARPALLLAGLPARLLGQVLAVAGTARMGEARTDVTLRLASRALAIEGRGGLVFDSEDIEDMSVLVRLLDPRALNPRIGGRDIRLAASVAGTFAAPLIDYRLTAPAASWGSNGLVDLRAVGIVRGGDRPLTIPVSATAARLTGVPELAAPLVQQLRAEGPLVWQDGRLTSDAIRFRTSRITGTATLMATPANGNFLVTARGALPAYQIPATGLADITADLKVVPAPAGARVLGRADIAMKRVDNGFFASLAEGLPRITADFEVTPDLTLLFRNTRVAAPGISLTASGSRDPTGIVRATASGTSRLYGPVQLSLIGPIDAPRVDAVLARPGFGIGLANVRGRVEPAPAGWRFVADGATDYGPITGNGLIRTATEPVTIDIANVTLAGITGQGRIAQTAAGPFAGALRFGGQGVQGSVTLAAAGAVQRADISATAANATLAMTTPLTIERGTLALSVLLPDSGPEANGSFDLAGIERENLTIDSAEGTLRYAGGRGTARGKITGRSGTPFAFNGLAELSPNELRVTADGTLAGRAIQLSGPAVLTRQADGWALAPVTITTPDGSAEMSGLFGTRNRLRGRLDRVSLGLLAVAYPALDLAGRVSGTIDMDLPAGGFPSGTAALRLNGLSRAGMARSSLPIDVGLNATLGQQGSAMRAVILRGGKVEGRVQARLGAIAAGPEPLVERLFAAPVFAQLRFNGPAQEIWGLTSNEGIDVRGPLVASADVSGILGNPQITGQVRSEGARVESAQLGTVIDQISLDARFTQSRLELVRFAGRAGKDGSIVGTGGIDLVQDRGFPMDIRLRLKNAELARRDDLAAIASGNVRIATDEYGGVLSGKLAVEKATYRIGRAAAVEVPVLAVTEKNSRVLGRRTVQFAAPTRWLLNMDIKGDRRLFVEGMGITSEWQADVRVRGGATTPELFGRVQLVRGDYDFAGKRFQLTRGDVRFQGVFPPDPVIAIQAENVSNGFTAQLNIDGTAQRPNIKFSSIPALPEDEVLSRVLFGSSVTDLSAPEALQLAGALASLRGGGSGGFNPIGAVRKGLGIDRLRVLPADTSIGRKTAVAAGQYIGRSVYVELATDAQGYTATSIEVGLTRSLSILSQVATLGGTSAGVRWKRDY